MAMGGAPQLTADLVARAIIAAAVSYGDDPVLAVTSANRGQRRACLAAISALDHALGAVAATPKVSRILNVPPGAVHDARRVRHPQFRRACAASEEAILWAVSFGLWAEPEVPAAPERVEVEVPEAEVLDLGDVGAIADLWPALDQLGDLAGEALADHRRHQALAAAVPMKPAAPPAASPYSTAAPRPAPAAPPRSAPVRPARERKVPRGHFVERRAGGVEVIRLKPVTDSVARHARAQIERGLDLAEAAELFDVDEGQLERAIQALGGRR